MNVVKPPPICFYGFFCFLFISGFFISACGSNGQDAPTIFSGQFTPTVQLVPGISNTIYLDSLNREPKEFLVLDVHGVNIIGQFERAIFSIDFSGSVIQYEDFTSGDFFGIDEEVNHDIKFNIDNPNRVSIDISRRDLSVVTGSGILISIRFRLVGIVSSGLEFNPADRVLLPPNGPGLFGINWFGGTIVSR